MGERSTCSRELSQGPGGGPGALGVYKAPRDTDAVTRKTGVVSPARSEQ